MSEVNRISEHKKEVLIVSPSSGDTARAASQLSDALAESEPFHFTRAHGLKELQKAVARADLVWLHDTLFLDGVTAFWLAQKQKKPVVVTRHKSPLRGNRNLRKFIAAFFDRLLAKVMLKNARQATFTCDAVAEHYYQRLPFAEPVKIIPNGVDLLVFRPVSMEKRRYMRSRFALRDETPVLLFVGAFTKTNGLDVIQNLAVLLPDWHFWLSSPNAAGMDALNPEKWFLPNVHAFRGRAGQGLAELYQSADRLILPGISADFPLAIQEAMACGLPVMAAPAITAGNYLAKPHLMTTPIEPGAPERTAKLWAEALKKQRPLLPLTHPKAELADVAHIFWQWPKIAGYYGDVLRSIILKKH